MSSTKISVTVKEKNPNYAYDLKTVLKDLTSRKVVAGFPKGKLNAPHYQFKWARRKEENDPPYPSIIDVAIKNNFGIGVPRRDFMGVAAQKWQKEWQDNLEKVQDGMAKGHMDVEKFLHTMGQAGASLISKAIRDWTTPPNSPYTVKMKGSNNPLVDSGDMKNAPRYELREARKE